MLFRDSLVVWHGTTRVCDKIVGDNKGLWHTSTCYSAYIAVSPATNMFGTGYSCGVYAVIGLWTRGTGLSARVRWWAGGVFIFR